ncbi:MAG TPA: hypothetical protein VJA00_01390, partial [Candidatus Omnitrophota bacterium]|nr:hypothetical protein [Candidatus Omnitrophota bacterium]
MTLTLPSVNGTDGIPVSPVIVRWTTPREIPEVRAILKNRQQFFAAEGIGAHSFALSMVPRPSEKIPALAQAITDFRTVISRAATTAGVRSQADRVRIYHEIMNSNKSIDLLTAEEQEAVGTHFASLPLLGGLQNLYPKSKNGPSFDAAVIRLILEMSFDFSEGDNSKLFPESVEQVLKRIREPGADPTLRGEVSKTLKDIQKTVKAQMRSEVRSEEKESKEAILKVTDEFLKIIETRTEAAQQTGKELEKIYSDIETARTNLQSALKQFEENFSTQLNAAKTNEEVDGILNGFMRIKDTVEQNLGNQGVISVDLKFAEPLLSSKSERARHKTIMKSLNLERKTFQKQLAGMNSAIEKRRKELSLREAVVQKIKAESQKAWKELAAEMNRIQIPEFSAKEEMDEFETKIEAAKRVINRRIQAFDPAIRQNNAVKKWLQDAGIDQLIQSSVGSLSEKSLAVFVELEKEYKKVSDRWKAIKKIEVTLGGIQAQILTLLNPLKLPIDASSPAEIIQLAEKFEPNQLPVQLDAEYARLISENILNDPELKAYWQNEAQVKAFNEKAQNEYREKLETVHLEFLAQARQQLELEKKNAAQGKALPELVERFRTFIKNRAAILTEGAIAGFLGMGAEISELANVPLQTLYEQTLKSLAPHFQKVKADLTDEYAKKFNAVETEIKNEGYDRQAALNILKKIGEDYHARIKPFPEDSEFHKELADLWTEKWAPRQQSLEKIITGAPPPPEEKKVTVSPAVPVTAVAAPQRQPEQLEEESQALKTIEDFKAANIKLLMGAVTALQEQRKKKEPVEYEGAKAALSTFKTALDTFRKFRAGLLPEMRDRESVKTAFGKALSAVMETQKAIEEEMNVKLPEAEKIVTPSGTVKSDADPKMKVELPADLTIEGTANYIAKLPRFSQEELLADYKNNGKDKSKNIVLRRITRVFDLIGADKLAGLTGASEDARQKADAEFVEFQFYVLVKLKDERLVEEPSLTVNDRILQLSGL